MPKIENLRIWEFLTLRKTQNYASTYLGSRILQITQFEPFFEISRKRSVRSSQKLNSTFSAHAQNLLDGDAVFRRHVAKLISERKFIKCKSGLKKLPDTSCLAFQKRHRNRLYAEMLFPEGLCVCFCDLETSACENSVGKKQKSS